ncbi:MAG TPA: hypothetical protein VH560_07335, partial [Polyangia bacterium]|nr:hypothetical protein [Polyangia bacterium]
MRKLGIGIAVFGMVATARASEGGDTPLMVAAEIAPGVGLDGEDVRRAIADELHRRVVAPALAPTVDAEEVLVVAVSPARIVVSFHARSDERAARAIATPPDRAARLRAVAWLAGNLARDQVSPLVMAAATATASPPAVASPMAVAPPTDVGAVEPPATAGSPSAVTAPRRSDGLALRATRAERSADPTWTVTVAGGPSIDYAVLRHPSGNVPGGDFIQSSWQLEVQRRRLEGWLLGGALDYGPSEAHGFGLAVTGGMEQRWRGFYVEESLGVGFESAIIRSQTTQTTNSSISGVSSETTTASSLETAPYARLFVTAAHPVWNAWDLVARAGVHATLTDT